jgi:hypothetical protein
MNPSQVKDFCRKSLHLSSEPQSIPGCNIYTCAVEVTPKMAADWLEKFNGNNRNLRQGKVKQHAADMASGRWLLTHQGLAFDEDGWIVSGQHRLHGLVVSGKTVKFVVFINCPKEERAVIDQTASRSARDVASLAYGDNVSALALAVCRTMKYGVKIRGNTQMTPQETYAFLQEHRTAIDFVLKLVTRKVVGITSASVLGPVCRAYYKMTREAIKDFMEVLIDGITTRVEDRPVILLRNWLLENKDTLSNTSGRAKAYARTEAALLAYMEDESPVRLQEPREELFPIAGDAA